MHWLSIPVRNRVLSALGRPLEEDFLWPEERAMRCIFFHIPKTGGIAICNALFDGKPVNHRLYVKCERQDPVSLASYWKFCIVRDPVARFLSAFRFLRAGGMCEADRRFRAKHDDAFRSLEGFSSAFRKDEVLRRYVHFRPQADFICDHSGRVRMDFIGRFEQLAETFATISQKLGVEKPLLHVNRGPSEELDLKLSSNEEEFILGYYAKDVNLIEQLPR